MASATASPPPSREPPTCKETAAICSPCCGGLFTLFAVILILYSVNKAYCHAKFSIQSITVSPVSDTWHVDFLVKNPSSRYSIYYEGDDAAVRFGSSNAAVLSTSQKRSSSSHTAFSLDFVAECNTSDVVAGVLEIKLRAKHKLYGLEPDDAGHVNVQCHNLTLNHENIDKIQLTIIENSANSCYLELFADTVSVSNANANARVSAAEWRIGFVARSPVTGCKISLRPIKSRLLRGDEVIAKSSSPSMDPFGQVVTGDETNVVFETVVAMPEVIGDVIWDIRVEIIAGVKTGIEYGNGFLLVFCGDIPVNFTADPAGNMIGSLLGNMRRCDYLYRDNLNPYLESLRS
ncbi:unnamed protein product, partial [Thlaspi arvense]